MKRRLILAGLVLAVLWFTGARWQRSETTAWAYSPVQLNGMRLAVRTVAAKDLAAGQAPVGTAGGTPHFIQFAWTASPTSGVDGYNLYGASTTGAENGTAALNGATLIPPAVVTSGCPAGIPSCVLYTLNQPVLQNGFFVVTADLAGNQSAFSNEAGPVAVPVNPLPPGAATVASKQ